MKLFSKGTELDLTTPVVMGILNVTPDSFSDGGQFASFKSACAHVDTMVTQGAKIIDIGGESTRPGAKDVSLADELTRVLPLVEYITKYHTDTWISVDTSKAEVMRQTVIAGAHMINDVRALQEPNALEVAAELNVPVCIMHMQGQPRTMQIDPTYQNVVEDIKEFFKNRIDVCVKAGIDRQNLILDVGFGFGKSLKHNYQLLANLNQFEDLGLPMLIGLSRKSMIGNLLNRETSQRLAGSLGCAMLALEQNANILRVHDVPETFDIIEVFKAFCANKNG